jgi:hypothetical protein
VVAEFACEWIGRPLEKIVDDARELEIKELTKETTRLKTEGDQARSAVADANARAAESLAAAKRSEEELAKYRAPWAMKDGGYEAIVAAASPFPNTRFDVAVEFSADSLWMMQQIVGSLKQAGWQQIPSTVAGAKFARPGMETVAIDSS